MVFQAQLGAQGDIISTIVWFVLFFVMIFLYPKLMISQTIWKLEKDVAELEAMAVQSQSIVSRKISKAPSKQLRQSVREFMDFFAVGPVDLDPYGIVRKVDMMTKQSDNRFRIFVNQIAPNFDEVQKSNIKNALAGAMTTHQIAKIVRHFLETVKKYKIFQLAMILQMQIPLIARIAKAATHATKAFADGIPVGDGIGPLVAASFVPKNAKVVFHREYEFVVSETKIGGKKVFVAKAWGPGASTGYPGKFLRDFTKRNKIDRIVTVDAALKLEGEKAGGVAEGVGVAMGGSGVDRYEIEEFSVKQGIALDAVAIKESDEEAIMAMNKNIVDALPRAMEITKKRIAFGPKNERILLIGVGNTCGVGNTIVEAKETEKIIREHASKHKEEKKESKWWDFLTG